MDILVRRIVKAEDPDDYAENWINCMIEEELYVPVESGNTIGDLAYKLIEEGFPFVYLMKPFLPASALMYGVEPTDISDGLAKPMDKGYILHGDEVLDIIYGNENRSNIIGFLDI